MPIIPVDSRAGDAPERGTATGFISPSTAGSLARPSAAFAQTIQRSTQFLATVAKDQQRKADLAHVNEGRAEITSFATQVLFGGGDFEPASSRKGSSANGMTPNYLQRLDERANTIIGEATNEDQRRALAQAHLSTRGELEYSLQRMEHSEFEKYRNKTHGESLDATSEMASREMEAAALSGANPDQAAAQLARTLGVGIDDIKEFSKAEGDLTAEETDTLAKEFVSKAAAAAIKAAIPGNAQLAQSVYDAFSEQLQQAEREKLEPLVRRGRLSQQAQQRWNTTLADNGVEFGVPMDIETERTLRGSIFQYEGEELAAVRTHMTQWFAQHDEVAHEVRAGGFQRELNRKNAAQASDASDYALLNPEQKAMIDEPLATSANNVAAWGYVNSLTPEELVRLDLQVLRQWVPEKDIPPFARLQREAAAALAPTKSEAQTTLTVKTKLIDKALQQLGPAEPADSLFGAPSGSKKADIQAARLATLETELWTVIDNFEAVKGRKGTPEELLFEINKAIQDIVFVRDPVAGQEGYRARLSVLDENRGGIRNVLYKEMDQADRDIVGTFIGGLGQSGKDNIERWYNAALGLDVPGVDRGEVEDLQKALGLTPEGVSEDVPTPESDAPPELQAQWFLQDAALVAQGAEVLEIPMTREEQSLIDRAFELGHRPPPTPQQYAQATVTLRLEEQREQGLSSMGGGRRANLLQLKRMGMPHPEAVATIKYYDLMKAGMTPEAAREMSGVTRLGATEFFVGAADAATGTAPEAEE